MRLSLHLIALGASVLGTLIYGLLVGHGAETIFERAWFTSLGWISCAVAQMLWEAK